MNALLVDDHAIVRAGLRRLFDALPSMQITEATTGREALALVRTQRPALVVLGLNSPDAADLGLLRHVLIEYPQARVLVLSVYAEAIHAARALRAGAAGYLSKNAPQGELLEAVRRVAAGGRYIEAEIALALALQVAKIDNPVAGLTEPDLEIIRRLGAGQTLSNIAAALGVSYKSVANTCARIKAKLGVTRIADLVRLAIQTGMA